MHGGLVNKVCPTLVTPWTVGCQAPLSMGFFRQEYQSGLPFSSPGDPPNPGIKPTSLTCSALAGRFFTTNATWEAWELGLAFSYRNTVVHMSGLKPQERALKRKPLSFIVYLAFERFLTCLDQTFRIGLCELVFFAA